MTKLGNHSSFEQKHTI